MMHLSGTKPPQHGLVGVSIPISPEAPGDRSQLGETLLQTILKVRPVAVTMDMLGMRGIN